jgi:hypothetical protein
MNDCCDDHEVSPLEVLPAGLPTLPRQLRGFAELRRDLLAALPQKQALASWRPAGDDLGLMWLEMWAYVADVLGFYDARIADETYLRTAADASGLRRLVALLGYAPAGGIAGRADVAVLATGRVAVEVPAGTAFRSRGFDDQPPQVFESELPTTVHPLKNAWRVEPFSRHPTVDVEPTAGDKEGKLAKSGGGSDPAIRQLLFRPAGLGLAVDALMLVESRDSTADDAPAPQVTRVTSMEPFTGKDGVTYVRVGFEPALTISPKLDLGRLRVRRPVQSIVATANVPLVLGNDNTKDLTPAIKDASGSTRVYFDGMQPALRRRDGVIVAKNLGSAEPEYAYTTIGEVRAAAVRIITLPVEPENHPVVPATVVRLTPAFGGDLGTDPATLTFHFDLVDAGVATNVGRTEVGIPELTSPEGVPIAGVVTPPPEAAATAGAEGLSQSSDTVGVLEQVFLWKDAADRGGRIDGRLTFTRDGRAAFQALMATQLPSEPLRLPLTLYGNVVATTRGERVAGEVLGNGDARLAHQRFVLGKKPLTYLHQPSAGGDATTMSTLEIHVDGLRWTEVPSFYGRGPDDRVYVVRHDDVQNTSVSFGDGLLGARLPSGIKNVVASYRFGAGSAAPPGGCITQLGTAVRGIDGVVSPVAAKPGRDPETAESLRTSAPRRALLLGRIVSIADYEAVAANAPGVRKAVAQWLWLDAQMQAGVQVHYIGEADPELVVETLRLQADPSIPLAVTRATPIPAAMSLEVEVDPRYVKTAVASAVVAHLRDPLHGFASRAQATIGGTFWPSRLYAAVAEVEGVVAVGGVAFVTPPAFPQLSGAKGVCLGSGRYLDFSAPEAVRATGVDPTGTMAPVPGPGGVA